MKKRIILLILFAISVCFISIPVNAANNRENDSSEDVAEIYDEQLKASGADRLYSSLPEETQKMLADMGISTFDYESMDSMKAAGIFNQAAELIGEKASGPLGTLALCFGIMLICSLVEGTDITVGDKTLEGVSSAVGALCICTAIVIPMCGMISRAVEIINGASGFILLYVPIMTGLMATSGHEISAGSYYTMLMGAGQIITQLSSKLIAPIMNVFLALSVTSSLSPKLNLSSLCTMLHKCAKWVLTLVMSMFVTVLSAQTFVSTSLDNVSKRALRFTVSSFVPVVGGVLSESLTAFSGSLELLKSGAGVFVIIAAACIFLPILIECMLWQFSLFILTSASDILGLGRMKSVYGTISTVASMLMAILLCILTIFIISTVIILMVGK